MYAPPHTHTLSVCLFVRQEETEWLYTFPGMTDSNPSYFDLKT